MAVYAEIAKGYRDAIKGGELARGDRLPIQPEMASEHGVSIATVHRVVDMLRKEGLIYTTHAGTYVGPRPEQPDVPEEASEIVRCHTSGCRNTLELCIAGTKRRLSIFDLLGRTGWIFRGTPIGRVYYCHVCAPEVKAHERGEGLGR